MAVFGLGYSGIKRPLETVIVARRQRAPDRCRDLPGARRWRSARHRGRAGSGRGRARLRAGTADVVIIAPEDPEDQFRAGEQSVIEVVVDVVDPVAENYAGFLAVGPGVEPSTARSSSAWPRRGPGYAWPRARPEATAIPPEVIAAPTGPRSQRRAIDADVIWYFAPAVLALILQHLAVTLVAMSLVRERTTGVIELFRIAPVSTPRCSPASSWRSA